MCTDDIAGGTVGPAGAGDIGFICASRVSEMLSVRVLGANQRQQLVPARDEPWTLTAWVRLGVDAAAAAHATGSEGWQLRPWTWAWQSAPGVIETVSLVFDASDRSWRLVSGPEGGTVHIASAAGIVSPGPWAHTAVSCTADGSRARIFIDGVLVAGGGDSAVVPAIPRPPSRDIVGEAPELRVAAQWIGYVDNVAVHRVELDSERDARQLRWFAGPLGAPFNAPGQAVLELNLDVTEGDSGSADELWAAGLDAATVVVSRARAVRGTEGSRFLNIVDGIRRGP
jgi:hypothetical protein